MLITVKVSGAKFMLAQARNYSVWFCLVSLFLIATANNLDAQQLDIQEPVLPTSQAEWVEHWLSHLKVDFADGIDPAYSINVYGGVSFDSSYFPTPYRYKLIRFLSDPQVQLELDFNAEHKLKLESVLNDYAERVQVCLSERDAKSESKSDREEFRNALKATKRSFATKLANLLSPQQQKTLSQMMERSLLRKDGIYGQLVMGDLGEKLEIAQEQKRELNEKNSTELIPDLEKETAELRQELVKALLGVLTSQQRDKLKSKLFQDLSETDIPVSFMITQLSQSPTGIAEKYSDHNPWPELIGLSLPYKYEVDPVGRLKRIEPLRKRDENTGIGIVSVAVMQLEGYRPYDRSSNAYRLGLKSSQAQIDLMNSVHREMGDAQLRYFLRPAHSGMTEEEKLVHLQKVKTRESLRTTLQKKLIDQLLDSYTVEQRETLSKLVNSVCVDRVGLIASLLDLPLGKEIGVSEEQKKELISVAHIVQPELMDQARKIESKYERELLSVLTDQQRVLFSEIVGMPTKHATPTPTITALQSDQRFLARLGQQYRWR